MPELPEVETMRRGVSPTIGAVIEDVVRTPCACKPIVISPRIDVFRRRVVGCRIVEVGRIGKRVFLHLSSGDHVVFEPRMTGLVLLADPPNLEHLRLTMTLSGKAPSLSYWDRRGLGSVRLMTAEQFHKTFGADKVGPDALSISPEQLRKSLRRSRRPIKPALLDQRAVAGVGNLYASELLHVAAVDPRSRCDRLSVARWNAIHAAMQAVLEEAILHEGSTLSDGTYRNALNQQGGYQSLHRVYDRQGQPCPRCMRPIERIVQAQRSTFFCRSCQKRS